MPAASTNENSRKILGTFVRSSDTKQTKRNVQHNFDRQSRMYPESFQTEGKKNVLRIRAATEVN
jgi:hypothetical protein